MKELIDMTDLELVHEADRLYLRLVEMEREVNARGKFLAQTPVYNSRVNMGRAVNLLADAAGKREWILGSSAAAGAPKSPPTTP